MNNAIRSFILIGCLAFALGIAYGWKSNRPPEGKWANEVWTAPLPPTKTQEAFGVILAKSPEEIEQIDTATLGWACLGGLPGSQSIDLNQAQARLTKLGDIVKSSTAATLAQARKTDKTAQDSAQQTIAVLSYVLQQDYKAAHFAGQFDPDHDASEDWGKTRPEDMLFQSALNNRQDTAFNNPIWFVAVGQQLKYPLKLASVPGRLCAVWDDGKDRLFIEPSAQGIEVLTERQFRERYPVSEDVIQKENLYHEYSQSEALAAFMQIRGRVLEQLKMPSHAMLAYAAAHRLSPATPLFIESLRSTIDSRFAELNVDWKTIDQANPERFNRPAPVKDLTP